METDRRSAADSLVQAAPEPLPAPAGPPHCTIVSRAEHLLALSLLAAGLALRIVFVLRYRVDTDEPQHLHVAWGWANGLLPYRDLFDNHMPLFHVLASPLVRLLGERPDLLVWMRLAMLPTWAVALACVYWIGRCLWSPRVGLWAAVWAALLRPLFLDSVEFRTDDLWMACWLLSVAVLVAPGLSAWRGLLGGLALGLACGVSQKTSLLLVGLLVALVAAAVLLRGPHPWRGRIARFLPVLLAVLAGLSLVLAGIFLYFIFRGAFGPFWQAVVTHNAQAFADSPFSRWPLVPIGLGLAAAGAWIILRVETSPSHKARRLFLVLLSAAVLVLLGASPIVARQTYLVIYPLLAVLAVAIVDWLLAIAPWPQRLRPWMSLPVIATIVAVVELGILAARIPAENLVAPKIAMWDDVLRLTDRGQLVMDLKGELVFRPRAWFPVLETVTGKLLENGTIPDDIVECLVSKRVCVASVAKLRLPPRDRDFIRNNYVSVGRLLVAGKRLDAAAGPDGAIRFDVAIPARYALFQANTPLAGILDGRPYDGPRDLAAGAHVYLPSRGEFNPTLVWAQALERGFPPVTPSSPRPSP